MNLQYFEKKKRTNPLAFFVPNGAQEKFINAVGLMRVNGKKIFINTSANGVGKTTAAVNILGNIIFGAQSKWFNYPTYTKRWPYPKTIWYISHADAFKEKIGDEFMKWFPQGRYEFTKAGRPFLSHLEASGWTLEAKTHDQNAKSFESVDVGIVVYDEPPPYDIRRACVSRLRLGGIEIFPMTPLEHSAWIFDELIEKPEQQKYVAVFFADVEENCIEHGVRGFLHHEDIEYLASQYDEDEREARLHGKPKHLAGRVYKHLHPDKHFNLDMIPNDFPQDRNLIYCVMDIHDRRPPAIIWVAVNLDGTIKIVDEFPNMYDDIVGNQKIQYHKIKSTALTFPQIAELIQFKEKKNGWNDPTKIVRLMDPNYGRRQVGALGKTIQDIFIEEGVRIGWPMYFITDIVDDLTTGHIAVKTLFEVSKMTGEPRMVVLKRCENTWHQLMRYGIREHSAKQASHSGLSERVEKIYKDFPDVVRYFAIMAQTPIQPEMAKPKEIDPNPIERDRSYVTLSDDDWRNPRSRGKTNITRLLS